MPEEKKHTQVLIIGGGVTGAGVARDLSLRGIHCILVEQKDINAGASGSNHGLLHSGARYVSNDPITANQCKKENDLLNKLAPDFIEKTGGLFVAIAGDDESYISDFPDLCKRADVSCRQMDVKEAKEFEPYLSDNLIAAYAVEDATVDPFGLSLANISNALELGAEVFLYHLVTGFKIKNKKIEAVNVLNVKTGLSTDIYADQVICAGGAWTSQIVEMAKTKIDMIWSKGTLLVTNDRLTKRVINRLRPASDADIAVPGGTVSILGTTATRIDSLDNYRPLVEETDYIIEEMVPMLPILNSTRYIRAFSGVRPLVIHNDISSDRSTGRELELIDHSDHDIENFVTITGGKLTTYRYMAEKTADLVCNKMSVTASCLTGQKPLAPIRPENLTFPGSSPKVWFYQDKKDDLLLCECEMVSRSMVDSILGETNKLIGLIDLKALGLRSRIGKGPCQGSFCSIRLISYLYDRFSLNGDEGGHLLREFIQERWIGQHPILWGNQLAQAELSEAIHCGLFCLER